MQALNTASNMYSVSNTFMRFTGSILVGAIITFALFVTMYELITQDQPAVAAAAPYTPIDIVFKLEESPEFTRARPDPLPKMQEMPKSQVIEPNDASIINGFSNFTPAPVKLGSGLTMSSMQMSDKEVTPMFRANPKYPAAQAQNGTEGYVTLSFDVTPAGDVSNIQVIDAEPKRVFDRAAIQALRKWRYQPKMVSGSPVPMNGLKVRLDFTLSQ